MLKTDTLCALRQAFQAYYETDMLKDSSPSTMCVTHHPSLVIDLSHLS